MKVKPALKRLAQILAPKTRGLGAAISSVKLDSQGTTAGQVIQFLEQNVTDKGDVEVGRPRLDFEGLLSAIGPEGHVTLLTAGEAGEPLFQMELLCEAGDWKGVRLGDDAFEGLISQAFELVNGPKEANSSPKKETALEASTDKTPPAPKKKRSKKSAPKTKTKTKTEAKTDA